MVQKIEYNEKFVFEKWEEIASDTARLKVWSGWMVRTSGFRSTLSHAVMSESSIFIPDPFHLWELKTEKKHLY